MKPLPSARELGPDALAAPPADILDGVGWHMYRQAVAANLKELRLLKGFMRLLGVRDGMGGPMDLHGVTDHDTWYSVVDYDTIDPSLGTDDDLIALCEDWGRDGLGLGVDLVCNHTSDQHPWYQDARVGGDKRKWYHWVAEEDLSKYAGKASLFPYHPELAGTHDEPWVWDPVAEMNRITTFYTSQPDLDNTQAEVQAEFAGIVDRKLTKGVKLIRVDAGSYLHAEPGTDGISRPGAFRFVDVLRRVVERHPGCVLLVEANDPLEKAGGWAKVAHTLYHFQMAPAIFLAHHHQDAKPVRDVMERTPEIPREARWSVFLRNHDECTVKESEEALREEFLGAYGGPGGQNRLFYGTKQRTAQLLRSNPDAIVGAHGLILSLRCKPWIYAGDEYGDPGDPTLPDRAGVRLPWNECEARRQLRTPGSILNRVRHLVHARNREPALKWGEREEPRWSSDQAGLTTARILAQETREEHELTDDDGDVITIHSFADAGRTPRTNLRPWKGKNVVDLVTGKVDFITSKDHEADLPPKGVSWLKVLP